MGRSAAVRQPIHAEEHCMGQAFGQAQRQPGLAAPQRAGDVSQEPDLSQSNRSPFHGQGRSKATLVRGEDWLQTA